MRPFRSRATLAPAHCLAIAFSCGLALSLALRIDGPFSIAGAVTLSVGAALASRGRLACLAGALLLAGLWWGSLRLAAIDRSPLAQEIGTSVRVQAEVSGPARTSEYDLRVPVRVRRVDDREIDEPAQLELAASERAPPQGAVVEFVASVRAPRRATDGGFDEASYLRRRGMHVVLRASTVRVVGRRGGVPGAADRLRAWVARGIAPGLSGERRAVIAGIVLGEDEGLDEQLRDRFRASGLYHLLAVSGQNIAYVVAGVLLAAWVAGVPRMAAQAGALGAIVAYVLAVGWQPSVVRAAVAGGLGCLAWLASRPADRWYFLLVGAAVLLAWNPYSLLDPGFQLSFAAVAAIFVVVPRLDRFLEGYPLPRVAAAVLAVSAACGLVTAPILWLQFGAIPVLSVVANAIAAPVVAPILGLGLAACLIGAVLPGAALSLSWANGWLAVYLAWCARAVGGLPFAQITSGRVLAGVAGVTGMAALALRGPRPWRRPLALALAVALAAGAGWKLWPRAPALPPPTGLRVSFLDVGQGDSVLLQVPEGNVLVDQGPPEAHVAEAVGAVGVRRLALLVLTHPQRDHIGGAAAVLRGMRVDAVLDPEQPNTSPYEDDAMEAAHDRGVPVLAARAGQVYRIGRLLLRVVWPDGPGFPEQDPNQHAIVILASYGDVDLLLTADAESDVTRSLELGSVEILKVAHHGSADDGLADLLRRLGPLAAVISVGAGNEYGHPSPSTLTALRAVDGLRLYRTDRDGTVRLESDGSRIAVYAER